MCSGWRFFQCVAVRRGSAFPFLLAWSAAAFRTRQAIKGKEVTISGAGFGGGAGAGAALPALSFLLAWFLGFGLVGVSCGSGVVPFARPWWRFFWLGLRRFWVAFLLALSLLSLGARRHSAPAPAPPPAQSGLSGRLCRGLWIPFFFMLMSFSLGGVLSVGAAVAINIKKNVFACRACIFQKICIFAFECWLKWSL